MPRKDSAAAPKEDGSKQQPARRPAKRSIGALWKQTARQTGAKYLRGHLDLGALGQIRVVVFPNAKKEGGAENQPDYRILLSTPLVQEDEE